MKNNTLKTCPDMEFLNGILIPGYTLTICPDMEVLDGILIPGYTLKTSPMIWNSWMTF